MNLRLTICAFVLVLGGCSAPAQLRNDTRTVGLYVQTVKKDAEDFTKLRDASTKARLTNITALELKTLRFEERMQRDLQGLQISEDKDRLRVLAAIQNTSAAMLVQRKEYEAKRIAAGEEVSKARSELNFQLAKMAETTATLMKLSEKKSLREDLQFHADFVKAVREQLEEDKENVKKTSADAADKANAKADANAKEKPKP